MVEGKTKQVEKEEELSPIQAFVQKNQKTINIVALSVIGIVVIIFVLRFFVLKSTEEKENKASVALSRILPYIDAADYNKALYGDKAKKVRGENVIGLIEIVEKYGGTPQGKLAALYAGNCFLQLNKYREAIDYFEKASKAKAAIVKEGANAGKAASYEFLKDYRNAAKHWELAAELALPIGVKDRYRYFAALCYEKINQKDKAEAFYREIIGNNQSEFVGLAKAGLVRLGTIIDF